MGHLRSTRLPPSGGFLRPFVLLAGAGRPQRAQTVGRQAGPPRGAQNQAVTGRGSPRHCRRCGTTGARERRGARRLGAGGAHGWAEHVKGHRLGSENNYVHKKQQSLSRDKPRFPTAYSLPHCLRCFRHFLAKRENVFGKTASSFFLFIGTSDHHSCLA